MNEEPEKIPVVSEELHTGARQVVTGGVRVVKRTVPHEEIVQQELHHNRVEVRRVQVNQEVDGPQSPREEGDTLIVPVMEEILKVQRVWVLKEEVHIRRFTTAETHEEKVVVSREEADVERLDAEGNTVASHPEDAPPAADSTSADYHRLGRTSILRGQEQGKRESPRKGSILGGGSDVGGAPAGRKR